MWIRWDIKMYDCNLCSTQNQQQHIRQCPRWFSAISTKKAKQVSSLENFEEINYYLLPEIDTWEVGDATKISWKYYCTNSVLMFSGPNVIEPLSRKSCLVNSFAQQNLAKNLPEAVYMYMAIWLVTFL